MSERTHGKNKSQEQSIENPHDHDVLSGRGNFVNYHAGNEYFRALVRQHKFAYIACPKPQKGMFSRMIVDEIRNRVPPGRFLKQDNDTKLWYEIGDKKALDKTRQALREGAPELMREIDPDDDEEEDPTPRLLPQGFRGASGFEGTDSSCFVTSAGRPTGSLNPPPNPVLSSGMIPPDSVSPLEFNGVIPGIMNDPSRVSHQMPLRGSQGFASLDRRQLSNESTDRTAEHLEAVYGAASLEPTPINPNVQIKVASLVPTRGGIQRDDSLKFDYLFKQEKDSIEKPAKKMENSSQHLSAMSFSIGDMTEASNLSAVFQDSMRITEDAPSIYPKIDNTRQLQRDTLETESKKKSAHRFDMSVASSLGSYGLEASMLHLSFRSGHDDDIHKD